MSEEMKNTAELTKTILEIHNEILIRYKTSTWSNPVCGVYSIEAPDGRFYIGASKNIAMRWADYRNKTKNSKGGTKLRDSFKVLGLESHTFAVLEICEESILAAREAHYGHLFDTLENGLNDHLPKSEFPSWSEERRRRQSETTKRWMTSPGSLLQKKIAAEKSTSILRSAERRQKMSESLSGKSKTEEHKRAVRMAKIENKGYYILNEETGIFYDTVLEAAESVNKKSGTLSLQLKGKVKNKTSLRYV